MYVLMRDEKEESEKEVSKVKQTTRLSNTAHPRQSKKNGWDSNPRNSRQSALYNCMYMFY